MCSFHTSLKVEPGAGEGLSGRHMRNKSEGAQSAAAAAAGIPARCGSERKKDLTRTTRRNFDWLIHLHSGLR